MTKEENAKQVVLELMAIRFLCIANYPGGKDGMIKHYEKGEIIEIDEPGNPTKAWCEMYPGIFRQLSWWECRSIDQLMAVDFVEICHENTPGYYRVGDQVAVLNYVISTKNKRFEAYVLGPDKKVSPADCFPADRKVNFENK